jgi:hypothetical protein
MRGTPKSVFAAALAVLALAIAAPAGARQQPAAEPVPVKTKAPYVADPVPRRGFNVVLLLGDMQGGDAQENIPVAARKALADMKDFLPYKNYRLLDTQWIIGGSSAVAVTRLRGVDDQEYELELRASPALMPGTGTLSWSGVAVRFLLREPGEAGAADGTYTPFHPKEVAKADPASLEISREVFQLERERDDLQTQVEQKRRKVEVGVGDPADVQRMQTQLSAVTRRIADLKQQSTAVAAAAKSAGRTVIDTSFRMDDGETVVVGTSRVKGGGKALIALLTATADRKGSPK